VLNLGALLARAIEKKKSEKEDEQIEQESCTSSSVGYVDTFTDARDARHGA
jgi:hypothetical protein